MQYMKYPPSLFMEIGITIYNYYLIFRDPLSVLRAVTCENTPKCQLQSSRCFGPQDLLTVVNIANSQE